LVKGARLRSWSR